jgi:hypothetical protein
MDPQLMDPQLLELFQESDVALLLGALVAFVIGAGLLVVLGWWHKRSA